MTGTEYKNTNNWIFLVDDDEDDQFLLQQLFRLHSPDCNLRPLSSGLELIDALEEKTPPPALIVLDLNMPFMSGFEVLDIVRQKPEFAATPIVILTTSDEVSDKQRALALGANEMITKPLTLEELNQVVLKLDRKWLV